MAEWIRVCPVDELDPEDVIRFDHPDGRTFAVYRGPDGAPFATDGLCTHEQVHLADGLVMDHQIECPKHNGRFDHPHRRGAARARLRGPRHLSRAPVRRVYRDRGLTMARTRPPTVQELREEKGRRQHDHAAHLQPLRRPPPPRRPASISSPLRWSWWGHPEYRDAGARHLTR